MYLSRLTLNPHTRRVQRELANPYELHRTLLRAFPEHLPEGERVLFRVEVDERSGVPRVLLQSHTRPDWAWLGDPGARDYLLGAPESKPFELTFAPGQTLAFRLRANPTTKRWLPKDKNDPASDKKPMRVGIYDEEKQRDWLARKGQAGGFGLLRVAIAKEGNACGWQAVEKTTEGEGRRPKARQLTLHAVRFDGLLQVTDPTKLWETVRQGVGSGKGLGFGLLSLAPPSR